MTPTTPHSRAFTIIELLITIAIIALLTGIVTASLTPAKGRSRDVKRVSDIGQLQLAFSLYFDRCKEYPSTLALTANNGCPSGSGVTLGSYISTLPTKPGGGNYAYSARTLGDDVVDYVIGATLEKHQEVVLDGLSAGVTAGGGGWSVSITCSNAAGSVDYCLGSK